MPDQPTKRRRSNVRPTQAQVENFAELMHSVVLRFGEIRETARADIDRALAEWRQVRGLCTMTEERLESVESRLTRLEAAAGLPATQGATELRGILANYGPALEALGVRPKPESAVGDAR